MFDSGLVDSDDPHAVRVVAESAADGGGDDDLEVVEPTSGVSVVMSAEDLPHAALVQLGQHLLPKSDFDVEVVFAFVCKKSYKSILLSYGKKIEKGHSKLRSDS